MIKQFLIEPARCGTCRDNPTPCLSIYHSEDKADYSRICCKCVNVLSMRFYEDVNESLSLSLED